MATISQIWLIIGIIFVFKLMNVNGEMKCCYSTQAEVRTPPNNYLLNITASHVNSKKGNNVYTASISFPEGYNVVGTPYSPFNFLTCIPSGTTQFQCESRDREQFFATFDLSIIPAPSSNTSIVPNSVTIYGDKCQQLQICTNLAEKSETNNSDNIYLGPFGTWPKYAVIIAGVALGITLLVAVYLVYRRNRPDETYRDRSVTPGTRNYDKRLFSPNSLLRTDRDDDLPRSNKSSKNTLIQFESEDDHSPERSKSVHVRNEQQHSSLTKSKSSTKKKKDSKDDGKVPVSTVIEMSGNSGSGSLEKSYSKTRRNYDKDNNIKRISGHSTSDMSKTITVSDLEWSGGGDLSDNNKNSSITAKHSNSNSNEYHESRKNRRSYNNDSSIKPHKRSISREKREGRIFDRNTSTRRRSHSRPRRKISSTQFPTSKSTGDLTSKSVSNKQSDTESKSSSDIPIGDNLPLAMLVNASRSSWKSNDNNVEEDDDTTPLGRISSYVASKTNSLTNHNHANYDSVLSEVLCTSDYQDSETEGSSNVRKGRKNDGDSEEVPIGQLITKE